MMKRQLIRFFKLKNRPASHPLILHIGSKNLLQKYAVDIPNDALVLAEKFWPGPLTLILKKVISLKKW